MKKIILLALCIAGLYSCGQKRPAMVEQPVFNKDNKEGILNNPPPVSQEKMFDAIIAKYKGKVVLVDFWGPGAARVW